jgi:hypothetical protein
MFAPASRGAWQEALQDAILLLIVAYPWAILLAQPHPEKGIMMRRTSFVLIALVLAVGTAKADPLGNGTKEERQACAPEAVKFCKHELDVNSSDTDAILKCLQRNRQKISPKCQDVLKSHGQ